MVSIKSLAAALLAALSLGLAAGAQATVLTSGDITLDDGDPSQAGRLTRNGVPSAWGSAKAVPSIFSTSPENFEVVFFNTGIYDQISWTFQVTSQSGDIFSVAYSVTFDPAHIQDNYLGDSGFSNLGGTPVGGQIDVGPGQIVALAFSTVNHGFGTVHYVIEGFKSSEVPVPASAMLMLAGLVGMTSLKRRKGN